MPPAPANAEAAGELGQRVDQRGDARHRHDDVFVDFLRCDGAQRRRQRLDRVDIGVGRGQQRDDAADRREQQALADHEAEDVAAPRPEVIRGQLRDVLREELVEEQLRERAPGDRRDPDEVARQVAATIDQHVYFPPSYKVRSKKISFEVPHAVLGGAAQDSWGYLVFVTGGAFTPRAREYLASVENTPFFQGAWFMTMAGVFGMSRHGGNRDNIGYQLVGMGGPPRAWMHPFGEYDAEVGGENANGA